jgi:hypothetical protein
LLVIHRIYGQDKSRTKLTPHMATQMPMHILAATPPMKRETGMIANKAIAPIIKNQTKI